MVLILLLHVYYMCVRLIVHVHIIWHAMSDMCCVCTTYYSYTHTHPTCSSILQTCVMCALPVTLYCTTGHLLKKKVRSLTSFVLSLRTSGQVSLQLFQPSTKRNIFRRRLVHTNCCCCCCRMRRNMVCAIDQ